MLRGLCAKRFRRKMSSNVQTIGKWNTYIGYYRNAPSERWQACMRILPDRSGKGRAMNLSVSDPVANRLLASLSHIDLSRLRPLLNFEVLEQGSVLHDAGEEV